MRVLFIITSSTAGTWLSEVTHPYWHLCERGIEVDFASPEGGKIAWHPWSDPHAAESQEADDLVSKGFLSDEGLVARLDRTLPFHDLDLDRYDAVHVAGGGGAAIDLYPNAALGSILEHFFARGKIVGAICHGTIALANLPDRVRGRQATGFSLAEDKAIEAVLGEGFIPNFPQPVLEHSGVRYDAVGPQGIHVVVDGKLVTGQNQQSASEYGLALHHALTGRRPVQGAGHLDDAR